MTFSRFLSILTARAYDEAGNVGVSSGVTVTVKNQADDTSAPIVTITSPAEGETVSGTVTIHASAGDDVGVTEIAVYLDGGLLCSGTNVGYLDCNWNTRKATAGGHSIRAVARDASGKSADATRTVSVGASVKGNGNGNGNGKGKK